MPHEPAPIHIVGPDDLHALDNIATPNRPSFGERKCPMCHGHGEWNDEYFVSGRAIVKACPTCEGFGWLVHNGHHVRIDIMLIQGLPHWALIIE
ncbi:hypothetical protein SAMN05444678_101396 [Sphingomonas sp. YR710]|jgi:hypothetical protein|uniref:hypothetical protein n=1 Tax=Sphingomonas sp. YR710 TaxID=1882773 RepID=UPI00087E7E86|nr:hypothetical protein [Sphingomonas sp. YR710]SDC11888.1 hypothetical protein SAMN05444678_101396 [Sphingomonas sp. YR710]